MVNRDALAELIEGANMIRHALGAMRLPQEGELLKKILFNTLDALLALTRFGKMV